VLIEDATSTTGFFVVVMQNGRLSQNINHCPAAHTSGRGLFRSLKPSAINFPLQVQWIDCGHWTHRSFKGPDLIRHKRLDLSSAKQVRHNWSTRNRTSKFPNFIVPGTGIPDAHDTFVPRAKRPPGLQYGSEGPGVSTKGATYRPALFNMRPFRKLVCIKGNSVENPQMLAD